VGETREAGYWDKNGNYVYEPLVFLYLHTHTIDLRMPELSWVGVVHSTDKNEVVDVQKLDWKEPPLHEESNLD